MDVKICPVCEAEYYAHVSDCADCGVALIDPSIAEEAGPGAELGGPAIAIREGGIEQLKELREVLEKNGIPCCISATPGCKSGGCGSSAMLMVGEGHAERAVRLLEEYYLKCYPESASVTCEHDESACPACGFEVAPDARECPDCGLALAFE